MSSLSRLDGEQLWKRLNRILDGIPHEGDRQVVRTYLQERKAGGIKPSTLGIDANALRGFCLHLGEKRLEDVVKADVVGYVNHATGLRRWRNVRKDGTETVTERRVALGPRTLAQRKEVLKPFFKWLRGVDEDPPEVKGLKVRRGDDDSIPTDQLIGRGDLQGLLQAHDDVQGKAILAVLYESGLHSQELCSLNIGSVTFDKYGAVLTLPKGAPGLKTGARRVRLFDSVPFLHAWFEAHPQKDDPRTALFFTNSNRARGARLSGDALWGLCREAGKRAGLKKDIHPHLFRHSAATERARLGWNKGMMRAFFGWSKNSDMPSRYVHLAGLDYENVELARRGLAVEGEQGPALAPLVCRVCTATNVLTAMFCHACRNPVSPAAEAELEARRRNEVKEELGRAVAGMRKEDLADMLRTAILAGKT